MGSMNKLFKGMEMMKVFEEVQEGQHHQIVITPNGNMVGEREIFGTSHYE